MKGKFLLLVADPETQEWVLSAQSHRKEDLVQEHEAAKEDYNSFSILIDTSDFITF